MVLTDDDVVDWDGDYPPHLGDECPQGVLLLLFLLGLGCCCLCFSFFVVIFIVVISFSSSSFTLHLLFYFPLQPSKP